MTASLARELAVRPSRPPAVQADTSDPERTGQSEQLPAGHGATADVISGPILYVWFLLAAVCARVIADGAVAERRNTFLSAVYTFLGKC